MPSRLNGLVKLIAVTLVMFCQLTTAFSQDAVSGTLERDKITAGQKFHLKVHFTEAPSFSTWIQQYFNYKVVAGITSPSNPVQIFCSGQTQAGNSDVDLVCNVPDDADGGIYSASSQPAVLGPRPGGSRDTLIKVAVPDFEVLPVQGTNVYPKTAVASISLDQKQILENGAANIEVLLDQLNTTVDRNSAETPALKAYLTKVAQEGQRQLEKSRAEYTQALPDGSSEPIVFEDFARRYAAVIVDIRAPSDARAEVRFANRPHLVMVQLSTKETVTVRPTPLTGSLGPLVSQLAELLGDHMAAFLQIEKSGSTTFTISLRSSPPGATISYKRIGEGYQDYSALTDVPQATFPYALWTFRFRLGNCEVVKTPNPFIEKSPNLNAQMQNCQKK